MAGLILLDPSSDLLFFLQQEDDAMFPHSAFAYSSQPMEVTSKGEVAVWVRDNLADDSKKEACYVGLKNESATRYMHPLLQTLYHIPCFRKAVYQITTMNDMPSEIPRIMQSLFYKLQYSNYIVGTRSLDYSFLGGTRGVGSMRLDALGLSSELFRILEDKLKETNMKGTIQQLFEGHYMDYKSTRKESFVGLQLDVKGCRDVHASFNKYVEGDNENSPVQHGHRVRCYLFIVNGEQYSNVGASQALNSQITEASML
ncbi:ubiquitin C-terminal hydrolase 12-like [Telopea speciosissima]|uniref:ubiquitin C-terminal hydrolase 12-like n=1 Tax=Telopea speciosissima TaxID=54955 RepID=UPI001CC3A57B|nr:ubiquitin C-terminal hydrolase 12-like [Telopea speciosissima]